MDNDVLLAAIKMAPASRAVDFLAAKLDVYRRRNADSEARLIWLIDAWSGGAGDQQIADVLVGSLGEHVVDLEGAFEKIGALKSLAYLRKAVAVCGGNIPRDEIERSDVVEGNYKALKEVDAALRENVGEDAAEALLRYLNAGRT